MTASLSSGAILSKTRAMFGRRLTTEDYNILASQRDLASAASYLGSLDGYRDLFDGIDTSGLHRREFEGILRHRHYGKFESLCRYELSIGEKFSDYILLTTEIELIMETLSRVMSQRTEEAMVMTASPYLDRRLKLDLDGMGRAQTYDELLDAVKDSVFHRELARLGWHPTGELITYENALLGEFYRRIFRIIDDSLRGEARDSLRDIFTSKIDLQNLVRIIRFKEYFGKADPDTIRTCLIPGGNVMGECAVKLTECKNSASVISKAEGMRCFRGKLGELSACRRVDELPERYMLKRGRHEMYFSPHPSVVMISYFSLAEIEIANIIKIIEGIRYDLSPAEITELLILPEEKKNGR